MSLANIAVSPSSFSGLQDDLVLTLGSFYRLSPSASATISSISGGTDGQIRTLINVSANDLVIQNAASTGTATNRILLSGGADLTITQNQAISIQYDSTTQRWREVSRATGAGGGGGSMSIGGAVTSGTTGSLLFVGSGPVLAQNNSKVFWDNTNFRLGIGTATPAHALHIAGNSDTYGSIAVASASGSSVNGWITYRALGTTASPTAVTSGTPLGEMSIGGQYDSTVGNVSTGVGLRAFASENWSASAQGAHLTFRTNSPGTTNFSEKMRLTDAGNLTIGSTSTPGMFNVGSSAQFQVTSGGAIAAATGITSSGTITFSGLTTNGGFLYTNGSGVLAQGSAGTSGQVLTSNGTGVAPTFQTATSGSIVVDTTALTSGTAGRILFESATNKVSESSTLFMDNSNTRLVSASGSNTVAAAYLGIAAPSGGTSANVLILNSGGFGSSRTAEQRIRFQASDSLPNAYISSGYDTGGSTSGFLAFGTRPTGGSLTERLAIDRNGVITANIDDTGGTPNLMTLTRVTGAEVGAAFRVWTNDFISGLEFTSTHTSGFNAQLTHTTGGWRWTNQLNIMGGNVGIATASPSSLFSVGSSSQFQVNSSGAIAAATGITSSGSITFSGLTSGSIPFVSTGGLISQNNSKLFWDNTNFRLGIGTATPPVDFQIVNNPANSYSSFGMDTYSGGASSGRNIMNFRSARGTFASPTDVTAGDTLAEWLGAGYAGGAFRTTAGFNYFVDTGTVSATSLPTGIYWETTANGSVSRSERMRMSASGNLTIGSTTSTSMFNVGTAAQFQVNSTGAIAAATGITSSGTVTLSGLNTANGVLYTNGSGGLLAQDNQHTWDPTNRQLNIGTNGTSPVSSYSMVMYGDSAAATTALQASRIIMRTFNAADWPTIHHGRARGSVASPAIVQNGDVLSKRYATGYDGSAFQEAGYTQFVVDSTPGSNDMPTAFEVWTTPDGSATATKKLTVSNSGSVLFAGAASGLTGITSSGTAALAAVTASGNATFSGRVYGASSSVTAANDLTLGATNQNVVSGATTINAIITTGWTAGSQVTLIFSGAPTVKHNTAGGGGTAVMLLAGSSDFTAAANSVLRLEYDGTSWHEISRKVA